MEKAQYRGCVYRATLVRTGKVYIGKSLAGLVKRRAVHFWHAKHGLQTPFAAALRCYMPKAFLWEELFRSDDDDLLKIVEIEQIASHRARGVKLYNISKGGDGSNGVKWTPEERKRRMAMIAERKALGLNKHTEATRKKLSDLAKIRNQQPHMRETLSQNGKKQTWTAERRAAASERMRVRMLDPEAKARTRKKKKPKP